MVKIVLLFVCLVNGPPAKSFYLINNLLLSRKKMSLFPRFWQLMRLKRPVPLLDLVQHPFGYLILPPEVELAGRRVEMAERRL